jgi:hypothetical protein
VPSSTWGPHGCITLHRRRRSAVSVSIWPPLGSPRSSCPPTGRPPGPSSRRCSTVADTAAKPVASGRCGPTELEGRPSRWLVVDSPRRSAQSYGSERPYPPRARCTGQSGIVAATDGEPGCPPVCHQTGAAARRDDLTRRRSAAKATQVHLVVVPKQRGSQAGVAMPDERRGASAVAAGPWASASPWPRRAATCGVAAARELGTHAPPGRQCGDGW